MIQAARIPDPTVDDIVRRLVERFRPRRVVLFGSRARGNARPDSDWDFMLELEAMEPGTRRALWAEANGLFRGTCCEVDVKFRTPERHERQRNDPGTVDYDVAREGIVLYESDGVAGGPRTGAPAPRVREQEPDEPASVRGWIEKAETDLYVVERLVTGDEIRWDPVCFHAQQAVEKFLKALLIRRWLRPERTHELLPLLTAVRAAGYAMPPLEADCALFRGYGVDVRYPDDEQDPHHSRMRRARPIPTEAEGRAALAAAQRIVAAVKAHLT